MNKSKIEWCDYSINPVKGLCPVTCKDNQGKEYCYARRMYKRFKWNPEIRYDETLLTYEHKPQFPDGSRVFVGSTMELFGHWVDPKWLNDIFHDCWSRYPKVTFIFLTKQPQELRKQSPFPRNCWIGCSATNSEQAVRAMTELDFIDARVKFLSLEPLLNNDGYTPWEYIAFSKVNWVIIGQQTPVKKATMPKISWVEEIVRTSDKAGIPVFLKNNLRDLLIPSALMNDIFWANEKAKLRQEFPNS